MNKVSLPELPWEEAKSPSGKFRSRIRNVSLALGGQRNVGTWGGAHPFDLQARRIPPGASACPFHAHLAQWELFVVQSGEGAVRAGAASHRVKTGDVFLHPPGEAHQLTNDGAHDLEVLIVADNPLLDACYYPDSDKWGLRPGGTAGSFFQARELNYFAGEDDSGGKTRDLTPVRDALLPSPAAPLFRKLHPDDLSWEVWQSPKGLFRGMSKELSIALGAARNTPVGLGGHPFDLELSKLGPGERGCPFHSHAAQWELFYFLQGNGTVRAGGESHAVTAGDVVLHPPREPHDLTNTGSTDLVFYLIADNPPVDYWHYPDSQKWGVREPRMFFRPAEVDYWDGEE